MSNPVVTINLVVLNGEKYIRHCLRSIKNQTYSHNQVELNILDNGSTDRTKEIIENWKLEVGNSSFASFNFIESRQNLGMWPGQEKLLKYSSGKYVVVLAVDVILDENFLNNAVVAMEKDEKIGALQPKIYKYDVSHLENEGLPRNIIDTCGFEIYKSRRIINIGHGERDGGQFNQEKEIFAVEGAVPVFRRDALESCRIMGQGEGSRGAGIASEIIDHDYFWYGDDLDIAWRMRVFGWKEIYAPSVVAWHDRQTTKSMKKQWLDYLKRVPIRQAIPIKKRRLEWRNTRFTIIKNDYTINILKDLPHILWREIMILGYTILFEPGMFLEAPTFLKLLPKIIRKRRQIIKRRVVSPEEMRKWFI